MTKLLKSRSGSMYVLVLLFMAVLGIAVLLVTEIMRIHNIASHVETELSRAVNIAVEYAIEDTWRIDKGVVDDGERVNMMDVAVAMSCFDDYLCNNIGLTKKSIPPGSYELKSGGKRLYRIELVVTAKESPPCFIAKGNVFISSLFTFIVEETQVPFNRISRRIFSL